MHSTDAWPSAVNDHGNENNYVDDHDNNNVDDKDNDIVDDKDNDPRP